MSAPLPPLAYLMQQKLCVAQLMDDHPDAFGAPSSGCAWVETVKEGGELVGPDRRAVDKALGMISALFRSAQSALGDVPTPGQIFAADKTGAGETVPPDPLTLEFMGMDAPEDAEAMALARSMTLYKQACELGLIDKTQLSAFLDLTLQDQPANTPLKRSAVAAARLIMELEICYLLSQPSAGAVTQ